MTAGEGWQGWQIRERSLCCDVIGHMASTVPMQTELGKLGACTHVTGHEFEKVISCCVFFGQAILVFSDSPFNPSREKVYDVILEIKRDDLDPTILLSQRSR